MNVAFLTYGYGLQEFGMGKYAWHLKRELEKLGVCVDVFTTGLKVRNAGPFIFFMENALLDLRKYDLVHSSEGAGCLVRHPTMVETYHHDYSKLGPLYSVFSLIEHQQCKRVRHIVVPSFATKLVLLNRGFDEDRISVIYHGVSDAFRPDDEARERIRLRYGLDDCFVVISVGRLVKHKRHIDIVKALEKIPKSALILVGRGECKDKIRELARKKSVRVLSFENIDESALVELLNAADVYVHASEMEGFGLSVIEAMACGVPVVAYSTADFQYVVGDAGFLLKQRDINKMHELLLFLQESPELRGKLKTKAQTEAAKYKWSEAAYGHLCVYKQLLANRTKCSDVQRH
jgi:glycosyltransferase involved in cell wall biosynthesis